MSGPWRRFVNVIMENRSAGVQTLRCIDHKLFNTKQPPPPSTGLKKTKQAFKTEKKMLPLATSRPSPSFSMRAWSGQGTMHCCPADDRRVLCVDKSSGRSLLMEADTSRIVMMPPLQEPKLDPISLYIPDCTAEEPAVPELDDDLAAAATGGGGGTFFIMDRRIIGSKTGKPEEEEEAAASCRHLFEALIYRNSHYMYLPCKCWNCDPLPPPPLPYVHPDGDADDNNTGSLEISSYAVVKDDRSGGSSHICISVDGVGTYRFDTASHEWSRVGNWTLPFQGKVEYVPELNLWFGFSAKDAHFAAADLSSTMINTDMEGSQQPQLLDSWQELEPPVQQQEGWQQAQDPQLVNLGSGRFCIARFFLHTETGTGIPNATTGSANESEPIRCYQNNATVLTGVEVVAHGFNEKAVNLGIVKHKTRCHNASYGEDTIVAVF